MRGSEGDQRAGRGPNGQPRFDWPVVANVDLKAAGYLRAHACCTALTLPIGNAGSIVVISVDVSRNSRVCPEVGRIQ
ncbi:hypothetical protein ACFHWW_03535 [Ensifer sp. P24N7]|uniref:hypothetical protein n=1 Tax=Sinorhizobium sp. P24N7 TaxID=3348358 RepID=UPI0035F4DFD4